HRRIEANGLNEIRSGGPEVTVSQERRAAVISRERQARAEADGLGIGCPRLEVVALCLENHPMPEVGFGELRVELQGKLAIGHRASEVSFLDFDQGAVRREFGFLGIKPASQLEVSERAVQIAFLEPAEATVAPGHCQLGIELDGAVEIEEGLVRFALLE